ncbi:MAG TPA: hypothetical protein VHD35_08530 [Chitinophagaceae bacterium]|nr:hypothetical protein [Chitinophagaceae bacterium]
MKKLLLAISLLSLIVSAWAQRSAPRQVDIQARYIETDKHFLQQVGIDFGLPVGDLSKGYSFGIGANYTGNVLLNKTVAISGDASYMYLFGKSVSGGATTYKYPGANEINILAGPKVELAPNNAAAIRAGTNLEFVNGDHGSAFAWQAEVSHMFASALGKIPVLGALFRYTAAGSSSNRMELAIFITPHIVRPSND